MIRDNVTSGQSAGRALDRKLDHGKMAKRFVAFHFSVGLSLCQRFPRRNAYPWVVVQFAVGRALLPDKRRPRVAVLLLGIANGTTNDPC